MEITRKLDEPDITLGNRVFLKDVNYTLNIQKKKNLKLIKSYTLKKNLKVMKVNVQVSNYK